MIFQEGRKDSPFRKDPHMKSTLQCFYIQGILGGVNDSWVPIGRGTRLCPDAPISEGLVKVGEDTVYF